MNETNMRRTLSEILEKVAKKADMLSRNAAMDLALKENDLTYLTTFAVMAATGLNVIQDWMKRK